MDIPDNDEWVCIGDVIKVVIAKLAKKMAEKERKTK